MPARRLRSLVQRLVIDVLSITLLVAGTAAMVFLVAPLLYDLVLNLASSGMWSAVVTLLYIYYTGLVCFIGVTVLYVRHD